MAQANRGARRPVPRRPSPPVVSTLPAEPDTHTRLVSIGFEGSVLTRQNSSYEVGRSRSWRKLKGEHTIPATIRGLGRDGRLFARGVMPDGRRCGPWVPAAAEPGRGQTTIVYSRADANAGFA